MYRLLLESLTPADFDRQTVCELWSVRDVVAHQSAVLQIINAGEQTPFTAESNQRDVNDRKTWDIDRLLAELFGGYEDAIAVIDTAGGLLDGFGLAQFIHGGDVRDAVGAADAFASPGHEIAVDLLHDKSTVMNKAPVITRVDGVLRQFGTDVDPMGRLVTDTETFVRLCGGRNPNSAKWSVDGLSAADFVLYG
ncbi:hypothetical protein MNBD_ACTINO02-2556 [hydrothermal vent metagenome]|uniref:Mycothiol-dependent maleylpyruvate isomerase metal-binding domain-containing protein n=1 Tax=hydrothermal vent metagenome TaxID=652676 RepID=A0A3B0SE46_9ZZZZ